MNPSAAQRRNHDRRSRVGVTPVAHGVTALLGELALVALVAAWPWAWKQWLAHPGPTLGVLGTVGTVLLLALPLGILTLRRARGLQPGTRGRGRLITRAITQLLSSLMTLAPLAILAFGASLAVKTGFAFDYTHDEAYYALPVGLRTALWVTGLFAAGVILVDLAVALSTWFLLPERFRFWFWLITDALLLGAFVYVVLALPLRPAADATSDLEHLTGPVLRLTVTAVVAARISVRALPPIMRLLERTSFELTIAARHLRAKKSGFLAAIGGLSILAVSVSTCMLTAVLSVMGGFRDDLKQKILGNQAHVVVDRAEERPYEGWDNLLERIRGIDDVSAATPYAQGEVMVSSTSNRAGAMLRGIDPQSVGAVTDLVDNLTNGKMEYLVDPHLLLDLPAEERRTILPLEIRPGSDGEQAFREARERLEAPDEEAGASADPEEESESPNPRLDEFKAPAEDEDSLDEFLREPARPAVDEADVLPGIFVGKELARTLRLFVGDELDVVSPVGELGPAGPMPKARRYRVAGIFYSGMYEYDMKLTYVLLEDAQRFLGIGDAIHGIEVKTRDVEQAPQVAWNIEAELEEGVPQRRELRVRDWQELNKNLFGALALEKLAMFVTLGIAILIAGFCVFGTLTLMVQEKGREVGILQAMGATARAVVAIFLFEGLLIGVYGALLGLGMGYLVVFVLEHFGIKLNPEVYYIDRLPVHTDPMEFVLVGISAVVVCMVATLFPAYLASRMRPVDALRQL